MAALAVLAVVASSVLGLLVGFFVALRLGRAFDGFSSGVVLGSLFSILGGLMAGQLVAGRAEEQLGTNVGVPFGLFVGCSVAATLIGAATGFIGALAAWLARN